VSERRERLERYYRRLLAWYPRAHRERHGEEMLGVLLAGAGEKRWPGMGESANLLWGAVRVRWRHAWTEGDQAWADALAIVSVLAPVVVLAGAGSGLHELGWFMMADGWSAGWTGMPWREAFPDAPVWLIWLAVAVLGVRGARRTAAAGAWLATIGLAVVTSVDPGGHWWMAKTATWVLVGLVAAVSLTGSAGSARGLDVLGRRRLVVVAATVASAWAVATVGYHLPGAPLLELVILVVGVVSACRPDTQAGRRAALVLVLPVMTTGLASTMLFSVPIPVALAVFYGAPLGVLVVLGLLLRRIKRRAA
jgi:hypothetical protein